MPAMTPDPQTRVLACVRQTLRAHDLLPLADDARLAATPAPVIVGVSGGADSVALLHILWRLSRPDAPAPRLAVAPVAAHLHHGLRTRTADADQVFVENLARRLGLPLETARADVRTEAADAGTGLEEAGRDARRRFFISAARRRGAAHVALGHTGADRAETVLFHVLRGTGIEGLAALGPRAALAEGVAIVRPLMHPDLDRPALVQYLQAAGLEWREDETNASDAFTRNRLRVRLLPLAREDVNPRADDALLRLAEQAADAADVLADSLDAAWLAVARELPAGAGGGPAVVIDADDFLPLRPWLRGAIVRRAVERLGGGLKHMSAARTAEVVSALASRTVAGPVALPGGLTASRRRRVIRIGPPPP
jgi:tRNA(Ile)-lysidine synthase